MTGSNLYTLIPQLPANHYSKDCDDSGFTLCGKFDTVSTPSTVANIFQVGCQMTKTDQVSGSDILFLNKGTLAAPVWQVIY